MRDYFPRMVSERLEISVEEFDEIAGIPPAKQQEWLEERLDGYVVSVEGVEAHVQEDEPVEFFVQYERAIEQSGNTRVGHWRFDREEVDEYVGRGTEQEAMGDVPVKERGWLGNPYPVKAVGSRERAVKLFREKFEERLANDDEFREAVAALSGSVLGCWCQRLDDDEPLCHAEVIAEYADRLAGGE